MKRLILVICMTLAAVACGDDSAENNSGNVSTNATTGANGNTGANASTPDSDTNPCFTEETVTMTMTAEDGLAVYYCEGDDPRACGTFTSTCEPQERLTFLQDADGTYQVRGRMLIVTDPDVGTPSGQSFPGVSEIPENTRMSATVKRSQPLPFGNFDGALEVTFAGDQVTIHTFVDPSLLEP